MKFSELQDTIPYVTDGKVKSIELRPYEHVGILLPGRHAQQTDPVGGDFCVIVDDPAVGTKHQFTHGDIFADLEAKVRHDAQQATVLFIAYMDVVVHNEPPYRPYTIDSPGMDPLVFLQAVQLLAVAEHRRYHKYEAQWGGRFLPLRFAAGVVDERWTAARASVTAKRGRPGVEMLERSFGVSSLIRELMC